MSRGATLLCVAMVALLATVMLKSEQSLSLWLSVLSAGFFFLAALYRGPVRFEWIACALFVLSFF